MYCFAFGFVSYLNKIGRNTIPNGYEPNGYEPNDIHLKMSLLFLNNM